MDDRCEELQSQLNDVVEEKEELQTTNEALRKKMVAVEDEMNSIKVYF